MFSDSDRKQIEAHGLSEKAVSSQVEVFKKGFPFMKLVRPCTSGDGIEPCPEKVPDSWKARLEEARQKGRFSVFVPASGAATRMFKAPLAVYHQDKNQTGKALPPSEEGLSADEKDVFKTFLRIQNFAFWESLEKALSERGENVPELLKNRRHVPLLETLLMKPGLGYSELPKGLLLFHRYPGGSRTSFEEHLWEALLYAADRKGTVKMHLTVSVEHEVLFRRELAAFSPALQAAGAKLEVSFSNQKPSTDTVAVDSENRLFRGGDGKLVFRPAGHGALLENLQEFAPDIVFIKNIDNIQPDARKKRVVETQEMLAGFLLEKQERIFKALERLEGGDRSDDLIKSLQEFVRSEIGVEVPLGESAEKTSRVLFDLLNRPIRVCGMVKNEGEPGGGPFWVCDSSGKVSRQIVEKSQVNLKDPVQQALLAAASHFNPVNLVCGVRDFKGRPFNLSRYVDPETGFISSKSKDGKKLKALELPGLWNGAMAHWMTYFVETPGETFAPVKELNDLLRLEHQP